MNQSLSLTTFSNPKSLDLCNPPIPNDKNSKRQKCSLFASTTNTNAKLISPLIRYTQLAGSKGFFNLDNIVDEQYLASGSFGKIYSATVLSPWYQTRVAIKKVPIAENGSSSALKEAEILKKVCHANIVTIYDVINNQFENEIWIVMEFLNGGSLRSYCTGDDDHLDFVEKLKISSDCWTALSHLHNRVHVTHKDIKPENILLHRGLEGNLVAKLCDFGLAKTTDALTKTQSTTITGTAMYFPPEYVDAIRNPEKADVYAMGATLCELFGRTYFWCQATTETPLTYPQIIGKLLTIWKQLKKGPVSKSMISQALKNVDRFSNARIRNFLAAAVCFDRHFRPTAAVLKNKFLALLKVETDEAKETKPQDHGSQKTEKMPNENKRKTKDAYVKLVCKTALKNRVAKKGKFASDTLCRHCNVDKIE